MANAPRLARALLALTAVAFVGTLAWLGPRWLEPVPDFGEIIGAISARKFGEANRLIERYVRMREPSSLSAILYTFPPDTPEPPAANLGILVPQGRILSEFLPVVVEDGRPGAEKRTYRARLEIEGKIPRDVGPGEAGNLTISMPTIVNDSLGPENAAGRVTVADSDGGTASAAFEIIGARLQRELGLRQQVISRIAGELRRESLPPRDVLCAGRLLFERAPPARRALARGARRSRPPRRARPLRRAAAPLLAHRKILTFAGGPGNPFLGIARRRRSAQARGASAENPGSSDRFREESR